MRLAPAISAIRSVIGSCRREDLPVLFLLTGMMVSSLATSRHLQDGIYLTRDVIFITCTGLALGTKAIFHLFYDRPVRFKWTGLDLLVCSFLVYTIVNSYLQKQAETQLPLQLTVLVCMLIYYRLLRNWLAGNERRLTLLRYLLVILTLLQLVPGFLQYLTILPSHHPFFKVTGQFFNPGPYAIYLSALMIPQLAFLPATAKIRARNRLTLTLCLLLCLCCVALFFSLGSRSSWIGGLVGTGFILNMQVRRKAWSPPGWIHQYRVAIGIGCMLLMGIAGYLMYQLKAESARGRLLTWKVCIRLISHHMAVGIGNGNFPVVYGHNQHDLFEQDKTTRDSYSSIAGDVRYAFNDELQILAEDGCIGFVLWLALLIFMLLATDRYLFHPKLSDNRKRSVIAAKSGILILVIAGLFSYPLTISSLNLLFWTFCAVISAANLPFQNLQPVKKDHMVIRSGIGMLSLFVGCFLVYKGTGTTIALAKWYKAGQSSSEQTGNYAARYIRLYPCLAGNGHFLIDYAHACMDDKNYYHAIRLLEKAKNLTPDPDLYYTLGEAYEATSNYDLSLQQYQYVAMTLPALLKPWYLIARMYYRKGDLKAFDLAAKDVMNHPVKVASGDVEKMKEDISLWLRLEQLTSLPARTYNSLILGKKSQTSEIGSGNKTGLSVIGVGEKK
jgi:O-antigen polymerase